MDTLFAPQLAHLTRRSFLRLAQRGLAALFLAPLMEAAVGKDRIAPVSALGEEEAPEMGRVLDNRLTIYDKPSFSARLVNMYWRDVVLPINGVTVGDQFPEHNRVWYLVNNEGYAHSGNVQPVAVQPSKPSAEIPKAGALGEICVPFTDTRKDPNRPDRLAYRLYYSAVLWVDEAVKDKAGALWYRITDDKYRKVYFAQAEHMRILPIGELGPIAPHVPPEEKRLEVRLKDQVVVAYEGSQPVFMARTASGGRFIDGDYTTPAGMYIANRKRPSRHMASSDLAAPSAYDLPGVPWVVYLTKSGISFHGTYWHNDFGKPRSHGCLNLSPQAARWVYRWSNPSAPVGERTWADKDGTRVDVIAA